MPVTCRSATYLVLVSVVWGLTTLRAEPPTPELLKLHTAEAKSYRMFLDEKKSRELQLQPNPVFTWTNLVGEHAQLGHLYVWTNGERPEVIATMFSTRTSDTRQRMVVHEFHSLSTNQIFPVTPKSSAYEWRPGKGITLDACDDSPPVAETASARLTQMRAIARSFSAESFGGDNKKWELRLLTSPLLHYKPKSSEVLEGALFAMVSSAGTDPEVLLLIEARHPTTDKSAWTWHAAAVRFSDKDLIVKRNDKLVWSSVDDPRHKVEIKNNYTLLQTPDKTYTCYRSRVIDELPSTEHKTEKPN